MVVFFSVEKRATFSAKMPQIEPSMNLCLIWSPFWDKDLSNFKRELPKVSLCCFVVNFVTDSSKSTTQGEESFQTWAKSSKVFWSCQISITEEHFQPKRGGFYWKLYILCHNACVWHQTSFSFHSECLFDKRFCWSFC